MTTPYLPPLTTGTEDTVTVAGELDRDDELEIAFEDCGVGLDLHTYERYLTLDQVESLRDHLSEVLERHRSSSGSPAEPDINHS